MSSTRRRIGIVGFWHETNTFSVAPTTIDQFRDFELASGTDLAEKNAGVGSVIGGFLDGSHFDLIPAFSAGAWPSGPVEGATMSELLDRAHTELVRAGALDGVLLNLHGAMVAEGFDDAELSALEVVRGAVGEVPIAGVLDLHANPAPDLVAGVDAILSYDTYPHIDMRERGLEASQLLATVLAGTPLRSTISKVPLLVSPIAQATDQDPMRSLQSRASQRAKRAGLHRVSVVGGFAYSDVARAGMSVIAVHDDAHSHAAADVLDETVADIEEYSSDFMVARDSPADAVRRVLMAQAHPVVLVDVADNVGGGSPGDGTALLTELLRARVPRAVVPIVDRNAALLAEQAGEGSSIETHVGGKTDDRHGAPIFIRGRVVRVTDGHYRTNGPWMTGREFSMGTTAVIEVEGVTLLVMSNPTPAFHAEQFTSQGIDPTQAGVLVVKGAIAWRGALGNVAREVIEVAGPGITPVDVHALPRNTTPTAF